MKTGRSRDRNELARTRRDGRITIRWNQALSENEPGWGLRQKES